RSLDPKWIEEALQATRHGDAAGSAGCQQSKSSGSCSAWQQVRDRPSAEVVSHLDLALPGQGGTTVVAPSSVAQARRRLGPEPLEWLFTKSAGTWASRSARDDEWRGLAL